jgi:hypothetical protein
MALLQNQIDSINTLLSDTIITADQAVDLLSATMGFSSAQKAFISGLGIDDAVKESLLSESRSTQEQIEEEIAEAKKSLHAGEYLQCRRWIIAAELTMASMPDYQLGNRRLEYREGIRYIKNSLTEMEERDLNSSALSNRRVAVRHRRS